MPHSHWGYWAAGRARVPIIVPVTDDAEGHGALRFWSAVVLIYAVVATILALLRLPSPFLFAGVVAGAVGALRLPQPRPLPGRVREVGLATIGVAAGSAISREVVETILSSPLAILGGVIATLAITMAAGQLLRLSPLVNGPTAIFASIAGGASGVTAVAREMDADEAIVLSIQYLRVLFVLATVTLVAQIFGGNGSVGAVTGGAGQSWANLGFTVVSIAVGLLLTRWLRFSASRLVVPMLIATGLSLGGVFPTPSVPTLILNLAYATTGLMVGLSLTRATVRQIARLMPLAFLQLILGVVGCAVVGLVFARLAGVNALDGYLATTPGGLPAVTAIAIGSGASVGLVITMQLVRIFMSLLLAPVLGAYMRRYRTGPERLG